jgi:hypothetical protein
MATKPKRPAKRGASLADVPTGVASSIDKKDQRRYAAEEALRTLTRAEENRSNPKLMGDVKRLAAEQARKMARIAKR